MRNSPLRVVLFAGLMFLAIVVLVFVSSKLREGVAPSDSGAAATSKLILTRTSPSLNTNLAVGSLFIVDVTADNTTDANVAELIFQYSPTAVSLERIIKDDTNNLYLNETINNTTGRATIDLARGGSGNLMANTPLVRLEFKVKSTTGGSTTISLANGTTLGSPSILLSTGLGSVVINYNFSATSKFVFTKVSPAASTVNPGATVVMGVAFDNTTNAAVAEIVLNYDHTKLTATAIQEQTGVLALNKNLGTGTGKLTVDIAKEGPGNFSANTQLVRITFQVKSTAATGNTQVTVNSESKLGITNTLATTGQPSFTIGIVRAICGDGITQAPNSDGVNEVCDDGNTANGDRCSNDCRNQCPSGQTWNGTSCINSNLPAGCKGDYNRDGIVNIGDLFILGQNYLQGNINCSFDIVGNDCRLDLADFIAFGQVYKVANVCAL